MPHYSAINNDDLTADLRAAHTWLTAQPLVKADKIGSIGFCLGGRVSFLANAVLPLAAAVSYYGGGMTTPEEWPTALRSRRGSSSCRWTGS